MVLGKLARAAKVPARMHLSGHNQASVDPLVWRVTGYDHCFGYAM